MRAAAGNGAMPVRSPWSLGSLPSSRSPLRSCTLAAGGGGCSALCTLATLGGRFRAQLEAAAACPAAATKAARTVVAEASTARLAAAMTAASPAAVEAVARAAAVETAACLAVAEATAPSAAALPAVCPATAEAVPFPLAAAMLVCLAAIVRAAASLSMGGPSA